MDYTTAHEYIVEYSRKQSKLDLIEYGEEFNFVSFERSVKFMMYGKKLTLSFVPSNYIENLVFHLFNPDIRVEPFIQNGMDIGTDPFKAPAGSYNLSDSLELLKPIFFGVCFIPLNLSHFIFQTMSKVSNNDMKVVKRVSCLDMLDIVTWD
ncbi:MAG: hypothetical protein HC932_03635 [Thermales bacterium]|nr:hypothetical protein [Thermales bacterium]